MTNLAAEDASRHILPLLDTQLELAAALQSLLQAEYRALLGSDLAALAELLGQKRAAAESLEQSSLELGRHTGSSPHTVIPQLGGAPLQRWQQLGDLADSLRKQNLHNGALLNERQNRLRWVAERAAGDAHPPSYAARPCSLAPALSGRSLARA
ncbi:MAG: flagellar export chaperone FlgN [Pseudomonadota bacterium]